MLIALADARPANPAAAAAPPADGARLVASAAVGRPAVTGRAVFWAELGGAHTLIRGYRLDTGARFTAAERSGAVLGLAADDTTLAWVERDAATGRLDILSYGLADRIVRPLLALPGYQAASKIALDRGVLYYTSATPEHRGLFAYDLASGGERLIGADGMRPVARDGALLWSEARPLGAAGRAIWTLHLRAADGRHADTLLARHEAAYQGFSGYDLSGDVVVWALDASSGDTAIHIQPLGGGPTALASTGSGAPAIRDGVVAWASAEAPPDRPASWRVRAYDTRTGAQSLPVDTSGAGLTVHGIAGQRQVVLAVADDMRRGAQALYLASLGATGLRFAAAPSAAPAGPSACNPAAPGGCGQVRAGGAALYDGGGTWRPKGVQFILPQFGINAKTFRTENYAAARADGSLDFWLGKAQGYLRTNVLRIFVDLPYRRADGTLATPTDFATLFDFAARANARGMRLAISLHNSADWAMTADRSAWIAGLVGYFGARSGLPLIAYVSADNEINNHCARSGQDCFDSDALHDARPYVDGAVGWVAQVRAVVKARAPQLLLTVGVSTELADVDATRGAFNFFRADSAGRTLASLVDFLAPHNYGGGAVGIVEDLRYVGYAGPVVLEEFGYPTDPFPRGVYWTEGDPRCRVDPQQPACARTAPFFVEENIRALRTQSYAGAVAWMLADMREKDTSGACADPQKPFDLWTGLFAIGGTYCDGGTYSRGWGQPKATAVRVCAYYAGDLALCEPSVAPKHRLFFPFVART